MTPFLFGVLTGIVISIVVVVGAAIAIWKSVKQ
jgi:hypothetical protein